MYRIIQRTSILALISLVFIITFQALPGQEAAAQTPVEPGPSPLERLASSAGLDQEMLANGVEETVTLIDGRQITVVKATNRENGQTIGAAFDGERQVDLNRERQLAWAAWRGAHGAIMPDLAAKLERSDAEARFTVAVWYKAQVEALRKPDYTPPNRDLSGSTAQTDVPAPSGEKGGNSEQKIPTEPLPTDQVPESVRLRAQIAAGSLSAGEKAPVDEPAKTERAAVPAADPDVLAQVEAFQQQNRAHLQSQIAPLRARMLDYFAASRYTVQYASETAPVIFLTGLTRADLDLLSRQPDVDAIYDASQPGGPLLDIARPTQNANLLEFWGGYTGSGVNVGIVEGERASNANPYLNVVSTRDTGRTIMGHPTGVAGIIGSFHSTIRGIAPGVNLYSANGDDYATIAALEAAMDWASARVPIFNNSFWAADCGLSSTLQTIDRHMDYIVRFNYDLAVVASGNFNVLSCDNVNPGSYVSSPGKGYNALTVGNYEDKNTLSWSDDTMRASSSYNISGRYKPEVAASGSDINSTTTAFPWTGNIGSGTSFSAPMVTGLAANLVQADSSLIGRPEALSAIIMATSLHNIEGSTRLSRQDGTGGIVASAAMATVERGNFDDVLISSSTTFPLEYTQYAYAGETVRFVIRWLSNPDSGYTTDDLPADLDLRAYRADGTTLLASSISASNNYEIVEFVAPASETYEFRVSLFGSYTGSSSWLGVGWWRGVYRISPDVGYGDPKASPMGTQLAVKPNDWSPTIYWRALGIRSDNSDHDLVMYSNSFAGDPALRSQLAYSASAAAVDYIVVDGNHWPSANLEHYRVDHWSGTGGYKLSRSNQGVLIPGPGWYGPFSMGSVEVVKVFDVWFLPMKSKRIQIVPTGANAADLGVALFRSMPADSATWSQGRLAAQTTGDASTSASQIEEVKYLFPGGTTDFLGLVVYSKTSNPAQFYIYVSDLSVFIPLVGR